MSGLFLGNFSKTVLKFNLFRSSDCQVWKERASAEFQTGEISIRTAQIKGNEIERYVFRLENLLNIVEKVIGIN